MNSALLTQRTIWEIAGEDRFAFLQGLISNDAMLLKQEPAIYAAFLSPQGKYLADFLLISRGDAIWLDVAESQAQILIKRLKLYKLRANVTFTPLSQMRVYAYWGGDAPAIDDALIIQDPRLPAIGWRAYAGDEAFSSLASHDEADYETHRIALGVPDGSVDMTVERSLLLEFDLESLHGISFSKGCYVGQEVTARSKHRGQVRKQLYQVSADQPLPQAGTEICVGDKKIGQLLSVAGQNGLAQLRSADISDMPLTADAVIVKASRPAWVAT